MHRSLVLALAVLLPTAALAGDDGIHPVLDLETGALWASRNDVAVPGDTGTRLSLAGNGFQTRVAPFVRIQGGLRWGRHHLNATFAPLRLDGNGDAEGGTVLFRGQTIPTGAESSVHYQLDTYRLTYRYGLVARPDLDGQLGVTGLVRSSEIRLSEGGQSVTQSSVGVLPMLSFRLAWRFGGPFRLALDGDAGGVPKDRAEDVSLALEFETGDLIFRAGYRVLEGVTDTSQLYNAVWHNQVLVGVRYER